MTQVSTIGSLTAAGDPSRGDASPLRGLNMDHFLQLMIAELQNQDPLNPLDNHQMLQQISQIREIGATDRLTDTLSTLLFRQNVSSATGLIGQIASGVDESGAPATGLVERVSIADGSAKLHLVGRTAAHVGEESGDIEAGTYRYRVVFQSPLDGRRHAVEVGPIGVDDPHGTGQSIRLENLPLTDGPKQIFRTGKSGEGDFHFLAEIDGEASQYMDSLADRQLSEGLLTGETIPHPGGRRHVVLLDKLRDVLQSAADAGEDGS
jgi:flagellar basal-body rod modification protein FlgD